MHITVHDGGNATLAVQLSQGDTSGDATRRAQRELQHRCFSLTQAWQRAAAARRVPQRLDERLWPGIAATGELAFRLLGSCWSLQRLDRDPAQAQARELFADGLPALPITAPRHQSAGTERQRGARRRLTACLPSLPPMCTTSSRPCAAKGPDRLPYNRPLC